MRQTWTILLTAVLLAVALTACGGDRTQGSNQTGGVTGGQTDGTAGTGDTANNGGTVNGQTGDAITGGGANTGTANGSVNGGSAANGSGVTGSNGSSTTNGSSDAANNSTANANGNTTNNGTANGGGSLMDDVENGLDDAGRALDNTARNAVRQSHSGWQGASYNQMLRNARVHDRDGDLTDMENSVTPGSTRF